jgi:catechol 2,3-dioxygenase-like lactoylglutathione lyase family enzyme
MIKKIEHIGVAVKDVEKSAHIFRDLLGIPMEKMYESEAIKTKIAFFPWRGPPSNWSSPWTGQPGGEIHREAGRGDPPPLPGRGGHRKVAARVRGQRD